MPPERLSALGSGRRITWRKMPGGRDQEYFCGRFEASMREAMTAGCFWRGKESGMNITDLNARAEVFQPCGK